VKPTARPLPLFVLNLFVFTLIVVALGNSPLLAADRGTLVREAILYLSPDTTSNKLAQIERGRELILLDRSPKWLHVEALLGSPTPDPAFVFEDEDRGKTVSGWVLDTGVVWRPPRTATASCSAPLSIPRKRPAADTDAAARRRTPCGSITASTIFSRTPPGRRRPLPRRGYSVAG